MQVFTRHFGALEVDEKDLISFENGIPGFEYIRKFVIIDSEDKESPFKWLQSFDFPEFAFVIADPFIVIKDYYVDIPQSAQISLEINELSDVLVYAIVVIPEDVTKMTVNLKCPVIINTRLGKGGQILIENSPYGIKHNLIDKTT